MWFGLILKAFLLSALWAQVKLYRCYHRDRPPVLLSLVDLVNRDLVSLYAATVALYVLLSLPLSVGLDWPSPMRLVAMLSSQVLASCLLLCASLSPVVQYLHFYYQRTGFFEHLTDDEVVIFLRLLLFAGGLFLQGIRLFTFGPTLYYSLTSSARDGQVGSYPGLAVPLAQSLLALMTNVVLRLRMSRGRMLLLSGGSQEQAKRKMVKYCTVAAGIFFVCGAYALLFVVSDSIKALLTLADMSFIQFCLVNPAFGFAMLPKLRRYAVKRIRNLFV